MLRRRSLKKKSLMKAISRMNRMNPLKNMSVVGKYAKKGGVRAINSLKESKDKK